MSVVLTIRPFLAAFFLYTSSLAVSYIFTRLSLKALVTTQKLERLIAAAPNIGFISQPVRCIHTPAASGIPLSRRSAPSPIILYMNAQNRFSWIFLIVLWLSLIAAATSLKQFFIITTSAASIATSVPAPIAIPISADVNAGASLIPSPTIITLPYFLRRCISFSLPSGRTPAITSLTPAIFPIALALLSLSPVIITT